MENIGKGKQTGTNADRNGSDWRVRGNVTATAIPRKTSSETRRCCFLAEEGAEAGRTATVATVEDLETFLPDSMSLLWGNPSSPSTTRRFLLGSAIPLLSSPLMSSYIPIRSGNKQGQTSDGGPRGGPGRGRGIEIRGGARPGDNRD